MYVNLTDAEKRLIRLYNKLQKEAESLAKIDGDGSLISRLKEEEGAIHKIVIAHAVKRIKLREEKKEARKARCETRRVICRRCYEFFPKQYCPSKLSRLQRIEYKLFNGLRVNVGFRRLVEMFLARKLAKNEHVHHLDGNHRNNALANLSIIAPRAHARLHHSRRPLSPEEAPIPILALYAKEGRKNESPGRAII